MQVEYNYPPTLFIGKLSHDENELDVNFTINADLAGELEIQIGRLSLDEHSIFIRNLHYLDGTEFTNFKLDGESGDGAKFECDNLIFTSLKEQWNGVELTIMPVASYSVAKLCFSQPSVVETPVLTWQIKGFRSYDVLTAFCDLGAVTMAGVNQVADENKTSGRIVIHAPEDILDVSAWSVQATELVDHVRHVMSFATGIYIHCPSRTINIDGVARVECHSQSAPDKSESPMFSWLSLSEIFTCAVKSFFAPKVEVKNLKFAIRWFTMRSSYTEGLLIASMTVLENILASNLVDADTNLMTEGQHKKLRRKISCVIKSELEDWYSDVDEKERMVKELSDRLQDLKRRSLLQKILILAERWGVEIGDITIEEIQLAKKVRDHVVHRGHYESKLSSGEDIHDQVLVVRELISRFILTSLGFQGHYFSYRGGYHLRDIKVGSGS